MSYSITRNYSAIDPKYDDVAVLCRSSETNTLSFRKYFERFNWNEQNLSSINECLKLIGEYFNLDYSTKCFVMHESEGYEVYTYDNERSTIDGRETYINGLTYLAHITTLEEN